MFLQLLTHLQVMPSFLDYTLSFGRRHYAQKFPYGGISVERRLSDASRGLVLRQLGRSGRDYSLCYNLRSVEPTPEQEGLPWSIRQMAIYHSFDVVTGHSVWIVVKANDLVEKRVKEESQSNEHSDISTFDTNSQALGATLAAHLIYVKWVSENWCWYIDFLEETVEKLTRRESIVPVDNPRQIPTLTQEPVFQSPARAPTGLSFSGYSICSEKTVLPNDSTATQSASIPPSSPIMNEGIWTQPVLPVLDREHEIKRQAHVGMDVLQKCQRLDETAEEAMQVINTNLSVLEGLVQFYESIMSSDEFPEELKLGCTGAVEKMKIQVQIAMSELQIQRSRAGSLSNLLRGRMNLLFGILKYCNLESNRSLAEKANSSATSVQHLTMDMHQIADKTKQETVSMRIITLVTLFFLPGTFVAVRSSAAATSLTANKRDRHLWAPT
jgi:hypothetical protein